MNNRDYSIDFVKGVLIWLVIFGHSLQFLLYPDGGAFSDSVYQAIYMFHMPLFAAISGYFFDITKLHKYTLFSLISHRGRQIILPMAFWVFLTTIVESALMALDGPVSISGTIKILVLGMAGGYWFIWVVFFCYISVFVIYRLRLNIASTILFAELAFFLIPLDHLFIFSYLSYTFAFMLPFFGIGVYLREEGSLPRGEGQIISVLAAALIFFASYGLWDEGSYIYVNHMDFINFPFRICIMFFGGLSGSLVVFVVLRRIYKSLSGNLLVSWISDVGGITLPLYLMQGFLFRVIELIYVSGFRGFSYFGSVIACFLFSIFVLVGLKCVCDVTRGRAKILRRVLLGL